MEWDVFSSAESDQFGLVPDNTIESVFGHFILSSASQQGLFSQLISEKIDATDPDDPVCLSFYYYFPWPAEYNLTIKLAEYNKDEVILWSLNDLNLGPNYGVWRLGQVPIKTADSYRIYIEAYIGNDPKRFVGEDT